MNESTRMGEIKSAAKSAEVLIDTAGAPLRQTTGAAASAAAGAAEGASDRLQHQATDLMQTWTKMVDRMMQPITGAAPSGPMRNWVEGLSGMQSEMARFMSEEMRLCMETAQTLARADSPQAFVQTQTEYLQGLAQRSMSQLGKLGERNIDAMRSLGSAAEKAGSKR